MAAFARAVQEGYHYLETDVHATADGVLVAFHDQRLDRVTDGHGRISDLPWAQVSRARIGGREPIPLMAEVLDAFPHTHFNIDPKSDGAVDPLIALLRDSGATDRVGVGSFSDHRLAQVRKALGPSLATALGPRAVARFVASVRLGRRPTPGPAVAAQVPTRFGRLPIVTAGFVTAAHQVGMEVHVWTVDDAGEMAALLDLGVDGIMTDRPDRLREVLIQRGSWPG